MHLRAYAGGRSTSCISRVGAEPHGSYVTNGMAEHINDDLAPRVGKYCAGSEPQSLGYEKITSRVSLHQHSASKLYKTELFNPPPPEQTQ